ncbi:unnamed protein product [Sphenostylis stenocarpa]|uniref:Uncharacterized protein n=1 Tax=Sphenostylis stenocarpa TaxID=92480 RepID=A0AA86SL06_9FABA|nr:unnamed protein product [Sphenostylis stenocarpa]
MNRSRGSCTCRWSRAVQAGGHGMVGSSPATTLVGTFVFGILSEEHPGYGYCVFSSCFAKESSRGIEDKNIASTFDLDNAKFEI